MLWLNRHHNECKYILLGHENERKFVNKPDKLACDDKNLCTYHDKCKEGICVGITYACDLKKRQSINTFLCAESLSCNGKFDGKAGGDCNYIAKAKNTACGPEPDACVVNKNVCDGENSECPIGSSPDPILHVQAATVTILPPGTPKKLYTRQSGSYMLHTNKIVSFKVDGVHASLKDAAQSSECNQYTLLWYLGRSQKNIAQNNVAKGTTKLDSLTVTSPSDLLEGNNYVICVQARNDVRQKVITQLKCSKEILIDRSPPSTGTIGFYADLTCKQQLSFLTKSLDTVHACWENFKDEQSSVKEYVVTVNKIENKKSVAVKTVTVAGNKRSVAISGLPLRDGGQYQLSITAFNYVNGQSSSHSRLAIADNSPPQKGEVEFLVNGLVCFIV